LNRIRPVQPKTRVKQYDLEAVDVAENTRSIIRSFKVVKEAKDCKTGIVFEKLVYIHRPYQRGNYQGRSYRFKLNSWLLAEIKRQITYKAQLEGVFYSALQVILCWNGQTDN
jgi:IS605 OrfB family transposase